MARIQVITQTGVVLMMHKEADLAAVPDMPHDENYVEIKTPDKTYEYFGPVIVERVTEKKEGEE